MWEVTSLSLHPGAPFPHARLRRVGPPDDDKTLSLQVLRDRRFYEPIA